MRIVWKVLDSFLLGFGAWFGWHAAAWIFGRLR